MTRVGYEGIHLRDGDVVVNLEVEGPDGDAEKVAIDLRDRAYRAVQALDDRANHPDDADPHPVTVDWDGIAERGGDSA